MMTMLTLQVENPSILDQIKEMLGSFQGVKILNAQDEYALDSDHEENPNTVTLAAMREVESGKDAGIVCMDSLDGFIASMK